MMKDREQKGGKKRFQGGAMLDSNIQTNAASHKHVVYCMVSGVVQGYTRRTGYTHSFFTQHCVDLRGVWKSSGLIFFHWKRLPPIGYDLLASVVKPRLDWLSLDMRKTDEPIRGRAGRGMPGRS